MLKILINSPLKYYILLILSCNSKASDTSAYRPDKHDLAKYVASIRVWTPSFLEGDNHICAGVIIAPSKVLTAAHCIKTSKFHYNPSILTVYTACPSRFGWLEETESHSVESVIFHPGYSEDPLAADIVILNLADQINIDGRTKDVIPIIEKRPVSTKCTGLGWGQVFKGGPRPDELLYVDLYIQAQEKCLSIHPDTTKCVFCASNDTENVPLGSCLGDAGAPLICNGYLAGIVTFGIGCGEARNRNKESAEFYIDTSCYRNWLLSNDVPNLRSSFKYMAFLVILCVIHT